MMTEMIVSLKYELEALRKERDQKTARYREIEQYRNRKLLESRRGNYSFYYEPDLQSGRKYLGSENNDTVKIIKEARYLDTYIKVLKDNIDSIENMVINYKAYDELSIRNMLPKAYQSKELRNNIANLNNSRAEQWLKEKRKEKAETELLAPDRYPESLRVQRANGELMRSKSEVMIADLLDKNSIPFIYELPHFCNGKWLRTDFTVLSTKDYKTEVLIEHLGLMNEQVYRGKVGDKIADYMKEGFRPNIDLFFTFDNLDQSFSLLPLQNIINTWLT